MFKKDVSLDIGSEGEIMVICGPSGSGKSTLIRSLKPSWRIPKEGVVSVFEQPLSRIARGNKVIHQPWAMVFQNFNLFLHLTVLTKLALWGLMWLRKMSEREAEKRVMAYWIVLLAHLASRYSGEHCGGQQHALRFLGLSRWNPKIMLFDEPTRSGSGNVKEVWMWWVDLAKNRYDHGVRYHEMEFATTSCRSRWCYDGLWWKIVEVRSARASIWFHPSMGQNKRIFLQTRAS